MPPILWDPRTRWATATDEALVLAVGSVSNDFGTRGVAQHCIFLDSRLQADRFRSKLLNHCLRVSRTLQNDPGADATVLSEIGRAHV